jgi:hypothetical protein
MDGEARRLAVLQRLESLDRRIAHAVQTMPVDDPSVPIELNGLYVTADQARAIANRRAESLQPMERVPAALAGLCAALGLDDLEFDALLLAAAPDIHPRYERLYGYLNDDVTRRRASIGLVLKLLGADLSDQAARARFTPDAALVVQALVSIDDPERPFLTRSIRVPDRVVGWLLGDDVGTGMAKTTGAIGVASQWVDDLASSLMRSTRIVYVSESADGAAADWSSTAVIRACGRVVAVDLAAQLDHYRAIEDGVREATLTDAGLLIDSVHLLGDLRSLDSLSRLNRPVVLCGRRSWDSDASDFVPLTLEAPSLTPDDRAAVWRKAMAEVACDDDPAEATLTFRLAPRRIARAAQAATALAEHGDRPVARDDLQRGTRAQNSAGLQRLAQRIEPEAGWDDLIVPSRVADDLRRLTARVRDRTQVLDGWRLRRGGGRGDGLTSMFAGPSGTGKTLAAEVIANALGVDLHVVDLATVVDKYIGETEKNLDRIFSEAQMVNTVLFFDEADALFGKRSEVKDARDRYANVEVAYLLQRMERFDGLCILATNLRLNIDDAFARRLDLVVPFSKPEPDERKRLWNHLMGRDLPRADDVDVDFLADSFELAGGDIRNAVVSAAFRAADEQSAVTMRHLVLAVADEYEKLGRLCLKGEFGDWYDLLDGTGTMPVPAR